MKIHKSGSFSGLQFIGHRACYMFLSLEKGKIRVRLGDSLYEIAAGETFLILPDTFGIRVGDWSCAVGGYALIEGALPIRECTVLYPDATAKKMLRVLFAEGEVDAEILFRHLHDVLPEGDSVLRKKIQGYVKKNLQKKLSLETAAEELGVSPLKLSGACKEAFGCGFGAYVSRIRMKDAKHLLQNKSLKISDITKRLGFASEQYFSIWFKKEMGMTPSDFRKYIKI